MTEAGFKREYFKPVLEGSDTANAALVKATLALDRIERHEEECGRRWGLAIRLLLLALMKLGALLLFLITDKLGWLS
ncbi:hypothetical protein [Kordiimonas aestuarii]|uniref:hypothetical protein n=1 Tax=Kordiimonas aestuarii TaxID=1005925 RepID=UPI0021D22D94|nr:hypothetical protein [Kordiimonas aestuarii]